jgi:uroporphyrin-III C-methyltransferase
MADTDLIAPGEVWLVGAGPGDPDLLTRKAERLIQAASVVFHDALVGPGVLALVPPHIRRIAVGKRSGRHSKDQGAINALLVEAALDGERVVRLKGGDPSIFGRSSEEMAALRAHGLRVSICPGITAASAAVASAGASLTLRGLARRLTFLTAHVQAGVITGIDWRALADPEATLAIYMGRSAAAGIAAALISGGLAADTPVLVAANISLTDEVLLRTRLDLMPLTVASMPADAPAVLIVGAAVGEVDQLPITASPRAIPAARSYI